MVGLTTKIKEKAMFWNEMWPTEFRIYRNRGDSHSPEDLKGTRLKYNDKPNAHKMRSGEKIPAIPLKYSMTKTDGTPCYHLVEADDEQLVAFRPEFDVKDKAKPRQLHYIQKEGEVMAVETEYDGDEGLDHKKIKNLNIDTDLDPEKLEDQLESHNFNMVNFSVLENIDERKTFLAEEIKTSETKYTPSSLLRQYPQLTLVVGTAVAITILMYATSANFGEYVPVLKELSGNMDVISNLAQAQGPPGN